MSPWILIAAALFETSACVRYLTWLFIHTKNEDCTVGQFIRVYIYMHTHADFAHLQVQVNYVVAMKESYAC